MEIVTNSATIIAGTTAANTTGTIIATTTGTNNMLVIHADAQASNQTFSAQRGAPGRWEFRPGNDRTQPPGSSRKTHVLQPAGSSSVPCARCCSTAKCIPNRDPECRWIASHPDERA